ncbi:MAG: sulfur oxidation c-type cytochrome SoxX [Cocleimonas sp.]|nr:sulfur oxidation c-type cytochrome SoxX [Cocleimonas sp.]
MRRSFRVMSVAVSALAIVGALGFSSAVTAGDKKKEMSGKELAFNKKKGNCLACHLIAGGDQAGNIAPPLIAMKARFPDKAVLRAQIADPHAKNPDSMMPPFQSHGILSDKEIGLILDFVYTL